jgi:hypothetical protein
MVHRCAHIAGSLRAATAGWAARRSATRIGAGSLVLGAVVVALGIPVASSAATSTASSPRDGYYAPVSADSGANVNDNEYASAALELFVIDKGKQVENSERFQARLVCLKDSAELGEGLNPDVSYLDVDIPAGVKLPIRGRSFSYSGPAYLPPAEIPAGVDQPAGTIKIRGTFKPSSEITGTTFNQTTVAFKGTVSATLCPTAHPTFTDFWSKRG